jgi:hypothetical protein
MIKVNFFNEPMLMISNRKEVIDLTLGIRGGASIGATGAKPHFIFGDQKKKKRKMERGFSKSSSYIAFIIYLKKEGSSMNKLMFENSLLKYIACFNIHDNEKQENTGTVFC